MLHLRNLHLSELRLQGLHLLMPCFPKLYSPALHLPSSCVPQALRVLPCLPPPYLYPFRLPLYPAVPKPGQRKALPPCLLPLL